MEKKDRKNVNLQNAEVTKMLDTKSAAKWPLTTKNCFDGKKQVVKGHFTCMGMSQYETLAGSASSTNGWSARQDGADVDGSFLFCVPLGRFLFCTGAEAPKGSLVQRELSFCVYHKMTEGLLYRAETTGGSYPSCFLFFRMAISTQPKYFRSFRKPSRLSP